MERIRSSQERGRDRPGHCGGSAISFSGLSRKAHVVTRPPIHVFDVETRDWHGRLKEFGGPKYLKQKELRTLCLSYQTIGVDDQPRLMLPGDEPRPWMVEDDGGFLVAHNAPFEMNWWASHAVPVLGFAPRPLSRWVCTAARCRAMGLPSGLFEAGLALGVEQLKDKEGHRLMLKYTKQRKPTKTNPDKWHDDPEEMQRVYAYCIRDVAVTTSILQLTRPLSDMEKRVWNLDQIINDYGFRIDLETVTNMVEALEGLAGRRLIHLGEITDHVITSNSPAQYKTFLASVGVDVPNMQAATVTEQLERDDLPVIAREVLSIRQELAMASVKKYRAFINRVEEDGRIRGTHYYYGGSTGRFASKGVQTQNMKRGWKDERKIQTVKDTVNKGGLDALLWSYGDASEAASNVVRSMIIPSEGKQICVWDFASIEARYSAWLAGEQTMLDMFDSGVDVYKEFASRLFNVATKDVNDTQRFIGKQCILGLSYGLGWRTFKSNTMDIAKAMGMDIELSDAFCEDAVALYRETFPAIKAAWYALEDATAAAVTCRPVRDVTAVKTTWRLDKFKGNVWLTCKLPSGRKLYYPKPRICDVLTPWDEMKPQLTYFANIQGANTGRGQKIVRQVDERHAWDKQSPTYSSKWQRISTYGGNLLENITQAVSRDALVEAMLDAHAQRVRVILHCHDEIATEVRNAVEAARLQTIMTRRRDWSPDCPIDAAGFTSCFYRKD